MVILPIVMKMQTSAVERLTANGLDTATIKAITCQRMSQMSHMYPNLVSTSRFQVQFQKSMMLPPV